MDDFKISMAAARVNAGLTQTEVAQVMGVDKRTVHTWESGKVYPKPAQLKMFCEVCKVDIDHIFLP